jgi:hypothetical protein
VKEIDKIIVDKVMYIWYVLISFVNGRVAALLTKLLSLYSSAKNSAWSRFYETVLAEIYWQKPNMVKLRFNVKSYNASSYNGSSYNGNSYNTTIAATRTTAACLMNWVVEWQLVS